MGGAVGLLEEAVVGWDMRGRGVRVGGRGMMVSLFSSREQNTFFFSLFSLVLLCDVE